MAAWNQFDSVTRETLSARDSHDLISLQTPGDHTRSVTYSWKAQKRVWSRPLRLAKFCDGTIRYSKRKMPSDRALRHRCNATTKKTGQLPLSELNSETEPARLIAVALQPSSASTQRYSETQILRVSSLASCRIARTTY